MELNSECGASGGEREGAALRHRAHTAPYTPDGRPGAGHSPRATRWQQENTTGRAGGADPVPKVPGHLAESGLKWAVLTPRAFGDRCSAEAGREHGPGWAHSRFWRPPARHGAQRAPGRGVPGAAVCRQRWGGCVAGEPLAAASGEEPPRAAGGCRQGFPEAHVMPGAAPGTNSRQEGRCWERSSAPCLLPRLERSLKASPNTCHILPPPPAQLGTPGSPRPAPSAGAELGHGAPLPSVGQSTTTPWDPKPPPTGQSGPAAAARAAQGGRVPTGCPLLPQGCSSSRPSSCTSKRAVAARRGWCATAGSSTSTSGRPRTWRRKR